MSGKGRWPFGCYSAATASPGCVWDWRLFEVDADGLVEKPALEILILRLLCKVLQTEQAGGIAFLNSDLEVTRRIEKRQLYTFMGIGVGFADAVDDLIPFEDDAKTAARASFLELVPGDIDDDVLEMID